ncbi:MAG: hypothetical protein OXU69_07410 [Gemmatimonadota bacterium]|nr:hypothetical protein [Gemmatimonadota bacterium]MDE2984519.1 hypothetical protein [Gemmatimonadota bacterium]
MIGYGSDSPSATSNARRDTTRSCASTPLSYPTALHHRAGRLRNVVLHDILADRLLAINTFNYRGRRYRFDLEDAHETIRLHPAPTGSGTSTAPSFRPARTSGRGTA